MMLTPRSYLFTRQSPAQPTTPKRPKNASSTIERKNGPSTVRDKNPEPRTSSETLTRPTTPSSPVIIPSRGNITPEQRSELRNGGGRENSRKQQSRTDRRSHPAHRPDDIPPSVAALLAITSIPPQKLNGSLRKRSGAAPKLTVASIVNHTDVSEKEFSLSLGKSSWDILLSPPDELDDDQFESESVKTSLALKRTTSNDSMPSLDEGSISGSSLSLNSLTTPSPRSRRPGPTRRLHSLSSPPGSSVEDHPLSSPALDVDELDFRVFNKSPENDKQDSGLGLVMPPRRKSAFKSNLTASLKALRSAAISLSTLKAPMITPEDFLTRSIISIDPPVPFTDERRPPNLEDVPTPALRRYLNPTSNAPIEAHVPPSLAQTIGPTKCTASIQMQTYKFSRAGKSSSPSVISRRTQTTVEEVFADVSAGPVARQREMRENSDFIRIAVMEMAMRRKGKLDDQKPGRARWALPARIPATKPYEIGANGVPARWIAVTP